MAKSLRNFHKLYFDDAAPYNDVSTPPSLCYDVRNYEIIVKVLIVPLEMNFYSQILSTKFLYLIVAAILPRRENCMLIRKTLLHFNEAFTVFDSVRRYATEFSNIMYFLLLRIHSLAVAMYLCIFYCCFAFFYFMLNRV